MSENFPQSGSVTVDVRIYAENTQLYMLSPPRLDTTVGIAVLTAVASRAARNIPIIIPMVTRTRLVCESSWGGDMVLADAEAFDPDAERPFFSACVVFL